LLQVQQEYFCTAQLISDHQIMSTLQRLRALSLRASGLPSLARAAFRSGAAAAVCSRNFRVCRSLEAVSSSVPRQVSSLQARRLSTALPEHNVLLMPALSPTMTQGNIASWLKKIGDKISPGDAIAELETDKATLGFEAVESGYLAAILVPVGSKDVQVGSPVAVIVEDLASVAAFANYKHTAAPAAAVAPKVASTPAAAPPAAAAPLPKAAPAPAPAPASPPASSGRIFVSPLAKNIAAAANLSIDAPGSGPRGRVVAADVQARIAAAAAAPPAASPAPGHLASAGAAGSFTDTPNSSVRKIIAQRLVESKQTVPHFYLTIDVRMDAILALRSRLNKITNNAPKISVNDFVVKASALALRKVPAVNSSWHGDSIRTYNYVDVCIAVATDGGLITPIVADADVHGVGQIALKSQDLAARARDKKLKPEEFQGGTFSISNLGMFGIKQFCAIINPPQACILAVGATEATVVPSDDGKGTAIAQVMTVTLSCDHRVVDGAVGAQWLKEFKRFMEQPESMML
jgi:pyruvate dehydrogenase E2 component (dihydrolipoamide acetyltransferase)